MNESYIRMNEQEHVRPIEGFGEKNLTVLISGGIVNPYGPTLSVIAMEGKIRPGEELSILRLTLNPFSQSLTEMGKMYLGEEWFADEELLKLFQPQSDGCPTLLMPTMLFEGPMLMVLNSLYLMSFRDGFEVLSAVRRYTGDPWGRVQKDINSLRNIVEVEGAGIKRVGDGKELAYDDANSLAKIQLTPENAKKEMKAFLHAWNGSIKFQEGNIQPEGVMGIEELARFFSILGRSCDVPGMEV